MQCPDCRELDDVAERKRQKGQQYRKRLCRLHRRLLPSGMRCALGSQVGDQWAPGAESPDVAKATKTRLARARTAALRKYRRGHIGLAVHIVLARD